MEIWHRAIGRGIEEPVLADIVDCMYGSLHPVVVSVVVYVCYLAICIAYSGDALLVFMVASGIAIGLLRCLIAIAYTRKRARGRLSRGELERSQICYAVASIAYAVSFGIVVARAGFVDNAYIYRLAVVLAVGYAQGLLIYVSVRPAIAITQALAPMAIAFPAALLAPEPIHLMTAPLFLLSMLICINSCRQQSRVFLELFQSRHVLARAAGTDALTGLVNRRGLDAEIERVGSGEMAAALYLDLDGFKAVNDAFGHAAGDALLCKVADRLRSVVGDGDIAARTGGDEFVVLLRGERARDARAVAEAIFTAVVGRCEIGGASVDIGVSIGISSGTDGPLGIADMVGKADGAMYAAKRGGRGRIHETSGLSQFSAVAARAVVGNSTARAIVS